jgi:hypothetical protein
VLEKLSTTQGVASSLWRSISLVSINLEIVFLIPYVDYHRQYQETFIPVHKDMWVNYTLAIDTRRYASCSHQSSGRKLLSALRNPKA